MRKLLSCGLITAAILTTALRVSAEPPPAEPVIIATESTVATDCLDQCTKPTK